MDSTVWRHFSGGGKPGFAGGRWRNRPSKPNLAPPHEPVQKATLHHRRPLAQEDNRQCHRRGLSSALRRPTSYRKRGRIKNQVMIDKYPPICDPEEALATQLLILPPLTHPKILRQDLGSALSIQTDRAHSAASTFAAEFQSSVPGLEWNRSPRMEIPMESGSRPDRSTSSPWPQERELGEVGH